MPFDGFVTKCIAEELNIILAGGRIEKAQQPERDEVHLLVRNNGKNYRLLISANAVSARMHLTEGAKENPARAPMFVMILRKYLYGGKIIGVAASGLERAVEITVESANEMGDVSPKKLIAEIMGKHSNIILVNEDSRIIDSLVHVDQDMSSVREVMPARLYTPPPATGKLTPGVARGADIIARVAAELDEQPMKKISASLLDAIMGASPLFCRELCYRAGVGERTPLALVGAAELEALGEALEAMLRGALGEKYSPCVVLRDAPASDGAKSAFGELEAERAFLDYYCWEIGCAGTGLRRFETMNEAVDAFYEGRAKTAALAQRKAGLARLISANVARCAKKLSLQQESARDSADNEALKLRGELIIANLHNIKQGDKTARFLNYYAPGENTADNADISHSNDMYIDVELDGDISPQANAQKYFKKYRKAVNTWKYASARAGETAEELQYLESVRQELEMSQNRQEVEEIRQELASQNYTENRKPNVAKNGARGKPRAGRAVQGKKAALSAPRAFVSSDGLTILVGKNNRQNDQLSLKTATANDIWLHAKNMPGSHVLIKKQSAEVPRNTLYEAASLAAYYSKAKMSENVNVDYTFARRVKKPPGAKPGMVIYDGHRTLTVTPDEKILARLSPALQ